MHFDQGATCVLYAGDNRVSLAGLPECSIDAVVTDPPYSLTFMGKAWDATGIERDPDFWRLVLRVLKPGGFVFAFAGARTGHWQACAMETAGFVMHPMHGWVYGSGFPKGCDASKAIDKHLGAEGGAGAVVGKSGSARNSMAGDFAGGEYRAYLPATPEAAAWDGWKYGTQTQKPALEPIFLGQKPYDGKPVESILKWCVGAFNIDGCRVPTTDDLNGGAYSGGLRQRYEYTSADSTPGAVPLSRLNRGSGEYVQPAGRYPANLLLSYPDDTFEPRDDLTDAERAALVEWLDANS